ncbi:MAG TPA: hypothetical protein VMV17_06980 [Streptosporangiaceae bacterium]|nr:hypothetical protein [Streptosporangiaceae bacterium]
MVLLGLLSALLIAGLLAGGTWAWWMAGRTLPRPRRLSRSGHDAQAALRRHPAGRERWLEPEGLLALGQQAGTGRQHPAGPDDDPEFISALERLIRGDEPGGLA